MIILTRGGTNHNTAATRVPGLPAGRTGRGRRDGLGGIERDGDGDGDGGQDGAAAEDVGRAQVGRRHRSRPDRSGRQV